LSAIAVWAISGPALFVGGIWLVTLAGFIDGIAFLAIVDKPAVKAANESRALKSGPCSRTIVRQQLLTPTTIGAVAHLSNSQPYTSQKIVRADPLRRWITLLTTRFDTDEAAVMIDHSSFCLNFRRSK
jgi:hypothetical protein